MKMRLLHTLLDTTPSCPSSFLGTGFKGSEYGLAMATGLAGLSAAEPAVWAEGDVSASRVLSNLFNLFNNPHRAILGPSAGEPTTVALLPMIVVVAFHILRSTGRLEPPHQVELQRVH